MFSENESGGVRQSSSHLCTVCCLPPPMSYNSAFVFTGVLKVFPSLRFKRPGTLLCQLAALASTLMGGTSGAVYGLLFSGAGAELGKANLKTEDLHKSLAKAWRRGVSTITAYSTARRGDRTMVSPRIIKIRILCLTRANSIRCF